MATVKDRFQGGQRRRARMRLNHLAGLRRKVRTLSAPTIVARSISRPYAAWMADGYPRRVLVFAVDAIGVY